MAWRGVSVRNGEPQYGVGRGKEHSGLGTLYDESTLYDLGIHNSLGVHGTVTVLAESGSSVAKPDDKLFCRATSVPHFDIATGHPTSPVHRPPCALLLTTVAFQCHRSRADTTRHEQSHHRTQEQPSHKAWHSENLLPTSASRLFSTSGTVDTHLGARNRFSSTLMWYKY